MRDYTIVSYSKKGKIVILLSLLIGIYVINSFVFNVVNLDFLTTYWIKVIMWVVIMIIIRNFTRIRPKGNLRTVEELKWASFYYAVFFLLLYIFAGYIVGFGKSPYDHSFSGIIKNILFYGVLIVGRELVRTYLINSLGKKNPFLIIVFISILMTFISIPITGFTRLNSKSETVNYLGETLFPEFSSNLFASYLVYIGGAIPAIIWFVSIKSFYLFSPILPNLGWGYKIIIGTLVPFFYTFYLHNAYLVTVKRTKLVFKEYKNILGWVLTSLFSILLVWFSVGMFSIYPKVIATGSMQPYINPGDVVIVKKTNSEDVQIDDVIQFQEENIFIFHRVIDIIENDGQLYFKTKGDNNESPDSALVSQEQVKGIVVYIIPKIGKIALSTK